MEAHRSVAGPRQVAAHRGESWRRWDRANAGDLVPTCAGRTKTGEAGLQLDPGRLTSRGHTQRRDGDQAEVVGKHDRERAAGRRRALRLPEALDRVLRDQA